MLALPRLVVRKDRATYDIGAAAVRQTQSRAWRISWSPAASLSKSGVFETKIGCHGKLRTNQPLRYDHNLVIGQRPNVPFILRLRRCAIKICHLRSSKLFRKFRSPLQFQTTLPPSLLRVVQDKLASWRLECTRET